MSSEPVTHEQIKEILDFQTELRGMINQRIDDLSEQLKTGVDSITARQDKTNGTLIKHDVRLKELEDVMASEVQLTTDIHDHGCAKLEEHHNTLDVITETKTGLSSRTKIIASGTLAGGLFTGFFIRYAGQIFHWFGHLLMGAPQ